MQRKTRFDNNTNLIKAFLDNTSEEGYGTNKNGSLWFDGLFLYSYGQHYVAAQKDPLDPSSIAVNTRKVSTTTTTHCTRIAVMAVAEGFKVQRKEM